MRVCVWETPISVVNECGSFVLCYAHLSHYSIRVIN